jgi:hypothetical protein
MEDTNEFTTYVKSLSKMITALGYTTHIAALSQFDVSKSTYDVVIGVGGEDNPPVRLGKYILIGIIAGNKDEIAEVGHVIPIISYQERWWVIDSKRYTTRRDGKMYPLPNFLTQDRTRVSGTNYTLNFKARNAQSVVKINPDSRLSINTRFGRDIFPGQSEHNYYVYARVAETVVQRGYATYSSVVLGPESGKNPAFYGGE